MQTPEPYFPSNSLNLNAMFYRTSTKKQKRKIKTVQFTHLLLSIHKKKRKKRNENGIKRKKTLANTLLWQAKPSAGTRRFRRSGKRRGCSVERRRATDNVARLVCEARAVASFEPPLSYFRAARATMPAHHLPAPTDLPLFHASFSSPSSPPSRSLDIPSSLTSQHRLDILSALLHGTRSTAPVRATHARRLREGENLFLFNHDTSTSWVEAHRVLGAIILLVVLLVPMSCASKSSS